MEHRVSGWRQKFQGRRPRPREDRRGEERVQEEGESFATLDQRPREAEGAVSFQAQRAARESIQANARRDGRE